MRRPVRVMLAGGGSGGSATPAIAVAERLRELEPSARLLLVGTRGGPERQLCAAAGLPFASLPAGRLRRYPTARNLVDPLLVLSGVVSALLLVRRFRPDVGFGAGGFASVPPLAVASLAGCPVLVHQQDVAPGLANRLLKPFAREFSVSLPASLGSFPGDRTTLTGNPVRASILAGDPSRAWACLGLQPSRPLLLATGGGTGALELNRLVVAAAPELVECCQIVHLTGRGRAVPGLNHPRYRQLEFVTDEMPDLLAAATLVVSRAGMGILSELSALGKPVVLVPMPRSHQLANARTFAARGAAVILEQTGLASEAFAAEIRTLLDRGDRLAALASAIRTMMPANAAEQLAHQLLALAGRGCTT